MNRNSGLSWEESSGHCLSLAPACPHLRSKLSSQRSLSSGKIWNWVEGWEQRRLWLYCTLYYSCKTRRRGKTAVRPSLDRPYRYASVLQESKWDVGCVEVKTWIKNSTVLPSLVFWVILIVVAVSPLWHSLHRNQLYTEGAKAAAGALRIPAPLPQLWCNCSWARRRHAHTW
jgi:hypothetical protein